MGAQKYLIQYQQFPSEAAAAQWSNLALQMKAKEGREEVGERRWGKRGVGEEGEVGDDEVWERR